MTDKTNPDVHRDPIADAKRGGGVDAYADGDALAAILDGLDRRAVAAGMRNKVGLWASYQGVRDRLAAELADCDPGGGIAAAALATSQFAVRRCPKLPPADAAELWAVGVHCRRILAAWTGRPVRRVSLAWLRARINGPLFSGRPERGGVL